MKFIVGMNNRTSYMQFGVNVMSGENSICASLVEFKITLPTKTTSLSLISCMYFSIILTFIGVFSTSTFSFEMLVNICAMSIWCSQTLRVNENVVRSTGKMRYELDVPLSDNERSIIAVRFGFHHEIFSIIDASPSRLNNKNTDNIHSHCNRNNILKCFAMHGQLYNSILSIDTQCFGNPESLHFYWHW